MEYRVEMWPTEKLRAASFQPTSRTDKRRLAELKDLIAEHGILQPLQWSNIDQCLGDGHRRLACAVALGIPEVPVIRRDLTADQIFACNAGLLPVKGADWINAVADGLPVERVGAKNRRVIKNAQAVLGDQFVPLVKQGCNPRLFQAATRVAAYIGDVSDATVQQALAWLLRYGQRLAVEEAMGEGIDPDVLLRYVRECKPIQRRITYEF